MQVVPSMDLEAGRSRLVWWPGASTGAGAPTDRPERIAELFAASGAPVLHLVDLDGARQGRPANLTAIAAVARAVAVPLQVAGGIDGPDRIEIAFSAGATRVVVPLWAVAEDRERLAACLRVAGDWMAVGLDARPERLRDYPWRTRKAPSLETLVGELDGAGVRRFVLSHGSGGAGPGDLARLRAVTTGELVVAGGVTEIGELAPLRDAGIGAVIVGEPLFTGAIDLRAAILAAS